MKMGIPKMIKQLKGFTGLVNSYRNFLKGHAYHLSSLTKLLMTKKGAIEWTHETNTAFNKVKLVLLQQYWVITLKITLLHNFYFLLKFNLTCCDYTRLLDKIVCNDLQN